ncbi:MAG: hypothetical protein JNJ77_14215 [Planctomycetia bacterium]|nr:hypothetical protein [Planctomycetia bacterium]
MHPMNNIRSWLAAGVVAISISGGLPAQDFTVPYNKTPETVQEFWAAAKYDLSLGNHARAAQMLGNYFDKVMAFGPEEQKKYFLNLYDAEGISPLLRLSTIPSVKAVMRKDPVSGNDRPAVDILIARMTKFIEERLSDPERIRFFVGQLNKRPEERAYAIAQLRASGARSIPAMLDVLRDPAQQAMHGSIFNALLKMDKDIGPPLLAALDTKSDFVKGTIIDVFAQRADTRIVPDLYYMSQAADSTAGLKAKAREWLMRFLNKKESELGEPRNELVATAELYHQHQVDLSGQNLTVWTWNEQTGLMGTPATVSQVEEARGIAYARKALELDPRYRPAQVELFSIALDKLYEAAGPNVDVAKANAGLQALLAGSPADLLEEVLSKALHDRKTNAALGAIRALAAHGDPSLIKSTERGSPALLQALRYPDRRVQFAAAEAALAVNTNGEPFAGSSRVVDVLRRAATGNGTAKILVGLTNTDDATRVADQLRLKQYDVQIVGSGRHILQEASQDGNVALIISDAALPEPGFSYFLTQYKNQPATAGLPLILIAEKDQARLANSALGHLGNVKILEQTPRSAELLQAEIDSLIGEKSKPAFTDAERAAQAKAAVDYLARMARNELSGFDIKSAEASLIKALNNETLAGSASAALAFRPTRDAQHALANSVISDKIAPAARAQVAAALRANLQRFGSQLTKDQANTIIALASASSDAALREQADLVASILRGDASVIGNRLKGYVPGITPPPVKVEPGKVEPAKEGN